MAQTDFAWRRNVYFKNTGLRLYLWKQLFSNINYFDFMQNSASFQKTFTLPAFKRGFHLITRQIEEKIPELRQIKGGIAHVFIHHTSASLTLNENADPTVRGDFERHFNVMVPENASYYQHTLEGPDDMPAHIKASLLGSSVSIPVTHGRFNLGTWQGIYLCEHRDHASGREITVTVLGF